MTPPETEPADREAPEPTPHRRPRERARRSASASDPRPPRIRSTSVSPTPAHVGCGFPVPGRERVEDNMWVTRVGAIYQCAMEAVDDYSHNEVVLGEPCRITGLGFGDWWPTTTFVALRPVEDPPETVSDER